MSAMLTRADVARVTGVSENAVAVAAREKRLAHIKIGGRYWYREDDVEAWLESMRVPAATSRPVTAQATALAAARAARAAR